MGLLPLLIGYAAGARRNDGNRVNSPYRAELILILPSDRKVPMCRRESPAMHTTKRPSNYERHRAAPDLVSEALGAYVLSFCNIIAESGGPANIPLARKCITSTAQPLTEPHIHQTFPTSAHRNMARVAWLPRSTVPAAGPGVRFRRVLSPGVWRGGRPLLGRKERH